MLFIIFFFNPTEAGHEFRQTYKSQLYGNILSPPENLTSRKNVKLSNTMSQNYINTRITVKTLSLLLCLLLHCFLQVMNFFDQHQSLSLHFNNQSYAISSYLILISLIIFLYEDSVISMEYLQNCTIYMWLSMETILSFVLIEFMLCVVWLYVEIYMIVFIKNIFYGNNADLFEIGEGTTIVNICLLFIATSIMYAVMIGTDFQRNISAIKYQISTVKKIIQNIWQNLKSRNQNAESNESNMIQMCVQQMTVILKPCDDMSQPQPAVCHDDQIPITTTPSLTPRATSSTNRTNMQHKRILRSTLKH